jgi:hypothetical protein
VTGKNRIIPTDYLNEFRIAEGHVLALSIPRSEGAAIRHFPRVDVLWIVRDVNAGTVK